jgi:hypothetical protein
VTQGASTDAKNANEALQVVSNTSFNFTASPSGTTPQNWLVKDGVANTNNFALLRLWLDNNGLKGVKIGYS